MNRIRSVVRVALACAVVGAPPAAKAEELCGSTVLSDLRLDQDLVCTGDGLVAGADGIKIDLNGHTIAGTGTGAGLIVTGRTAVTIVGGTVTNFAVAVRVNTSTNVVIRDNELVGNLEGVDLQAGSVGVRIRDNTFRDSGIRAIMLRSNSLDNEIKDNTFTGNRVGVLLFGTANATVKDNTISGSSLAAIRINVIATANLLKDNLVDSNAVGIEFLVTPTGSSIGNELKGNTVSSNRCGLLGPTDGNRLKDNVFSGNLADSCN